MLLSTRTTPSRERTVRKPRWASSRSSKGTNRRGYSRNNREFIARPEATQESLKTQSLSSTCLSGKSCGLLVVFWTGFIAGVRLMTSCRLWCQNRWCRRCSHRYCTAGRPDKLTSQIKLHIWWQSVLHDVKELCDRCERCEAGLPDFYGVNIPNTAKFYAKYAN